MTRPRNRVARFFGRLRTPYLVLCNTALLFLLLELGTRAVLQVRHATGPDPDGARRRDESIHAVFQAMRAPGPHVARGPDLAGIVVSPDLSSAAVAGRAQAPMRILFLGGSTTANDYPLRVRKQLEAARVRTQVFNAASDGASSLDSLHKFWTYADVIDPDVVVVLHAINDFTRGFTPPGMLPEYRSDYSHFVWNRHWHVRESAYDGRPVFTEGPLHRATVGSLLSSMFHGSRLVEEVRQRLPRDTRTASMSDDVVLRSLPAFRRHLGNLVASVRHRGTPIVLLTMPFTGTPPKRAFVHPGPHFTNDGTTYLDGAGFERGMRAFNDAVRTFAGPGVRVLDVARDITDGASFVDEVHLTAVGRRSLATRVAAAVR